MEEKIVQEEREQFCFECSVRLNEQNMVEFNGNSMCLDCYERLTVTCNHCGERTWRSYAVHDNDISLCNCCYEDHYTRCDLCNRIIHFDNTYYEGDSDIPYCESCFDNRRESPIKPYNYKPEPIFFGSGNLFMGVELEIDKGGEIYDNADEIMDIANSNGIHMYCKHDGSIDDGFEMVSHPMTLDYHINTMNWKEVFSHAVEMGYRSHQTNTCGLHIHVNRNAFGDSYSQQEEVISRIVYIIENHWNELVKFSRRTEYNLARWANRYGIMTTAKETYKSAKDKHCGRYVAVNLNNDHTIEFRMFRGTLNHNTFVATLQLVDEICNLAMQHDDKYVETLPWSEFAASIDAEKKPELIEYLKEKRLYVNDVSSEREEK